MFGLVGVLLGGTLHFFFSTAGWRREAARGARLVLHESLDVIWSEDYTPVRRWAGRLRVHLSSVGIEQSRIERLVEIAEANFRDQLTMRERFDPEERGVRKDLSDCLEDAIKATDQQLMHASRPRLLRGRGPAMPTLPKLRA